MKSASLLLALLLLAAPVSAQQVLGQVGVLPGGAVLLSAASCTATSPFAAPVAYVSRCFNTTNGVTYTWDGTGWQSDAALAIKTFIVTDPRWGAKCDGVADDLAALNRVAAALPANGPARIVLPGLCALSGEWLIQNKNNFSIVGYGPDVSGLRFQNGLTNPGDVLYLLNVSGVTVSNLQIYGNRTNFVAGWNEFNNCIALQASVAGTYTDFEFTGLHIINCGGDGILVQGQTTNANQLLQNVRITNSLIEDLNQGGVGANRNAITVTGVDGLTVSNIQCDGPAPDSSTTACVHLEMDAASQTIKNATLGPINVRDINGVVGIASVGAMNNINIGQVTMIGHATNKRRFGVALSGTVDHVNLDGPFNIYMPATVSGQAGIQVDRLATNVKGPGNFNVKVVGAGSNCIQSTGISDGTTAWTIGPGTVHGCTGNGIYSKRLQTNVIGVTANANGGDGIQIDNIANGDFAINANWSYGNTGYGLNIVAAGMDYYTISGNVFDVNTAGNLNDASAGAHRNIIGNEGVVNTLYAATTLLTPLGLASGGMNASMTASNGGIFYSTATAGAILPGTATAHQALLSGASTTPAWSTATYPATTTNKQILYSTADNVIGGNANLIYDGTVFTLGGGNSINMVGGGTGYELIQMSNTSGNIVLGVESSPASFFGAGGIAYAAAFGTAAAKPIEFATNNTVRWVIGTTGGLYSTNATGTDKGADTINAAGAYYSNGTIGVTCAGAPTVNFASTLGIVTHC